MSDRHVIDMLASEFYNLNRQTHPWHVHSAQYPQLPLLSQAGKSALAVPVMQPNHPSEEACLSMTALSAPETSQQALMYSTALRCRHPSVKRTTPPSPWGRNRACVLDLIPAPSDFWERAEIFPLTECDAGNDVLARAAGPMCNISGLEGEVPLISNMKTGTCRWASCILQNPTGTAASICLWQQSGLLQRRSTWCVPDQLTSCCICSLAADAASTAICFVSLPDKYAAATPASAAPATCQHCH